MRKLLTALVAVCLLVTAFVVVSPTEPAEATVTWPQQVPDTEVMRVIANDVDNLSLLSCNDTDRGNVVYRKLDGDITTDSYPKSGNFYCNPSPYETEVQGSDGTIYGTYVDASLAGTSYYAAIKNGRVKWATDISSDPDCGTTSSEMMTPQSMSIGPDGNVYMLIKSPYSACAKYLLALDSDNGSELFKIQLGTGSGYGVLTKVWTYDDRIIVVDQNGVKREFDYDGVEDTGAQYSFAASNGGMAYANGDGRVFFLSSSTTSGGVCTVGTISYRDLSGATASMNRIEGCAGPSLSQVMALPDGKLAGYVGNNNVHIFDVTVGTYSTLTLPIPSGYKTNSQSFIVGYYVDEDKNAVFVRQLRKSTSSAMATFVDYVEHGTNNATNLYQRVGNGSASNTPEARFGDITNGYLYLPVSYSYSTTSPYERDVWIQKIDVGTSGFGDVVEATFGFSEPDEQLNYVAMGDSFSSGEGSPDFNPATDISGVNMCHRSNEDVYSLLFSNGYGVHLTDFVACSGATTDTVLNGGSSGGAWGEPAQVSALSSDTDIVTITIGGNDVGFKDYATSCAASGFCEVGMSSYENIMDAIDGSLQADLQATYQEILDGADNATLYVLSYPYLIDPSATCTTFGWAEDAGVVNVIDNLNEKIEDAVDAVNNDLINTSNYGRIEYVDVNYSGSPFEDHYLCSSIPYFNGASLSHPEFSFHPNGVGQAAYEEVLANTI